jgi:hypothetical protein
MTGWVVRLKKRSGAGHDHQPAPRLPSTIAWPRGASRGEMSWATGATGYATSVGPSLKLGLSRVVQ